MKSIEQAADTTHRHVDSIDNNVTQLDKRVEALKHGMGIRERKEAELKETQETLTTRVETTAKNPATFKREQSDRVGEVKESMDTL